MPSGRRAYGAFLGAKLCFALIALALPAFSQTAGPFASLHAQLAAAADAALVQPSPPVTPSGAHPDTGRAKSKDPYPATAAPGGTRINQLRPVIDRILRDHGVPPEFAAIVLVESGGDPAALSPKGARGLWQIMPETARRYGLVVSQARDDRLDLIKSTQVAARYLRDLYIQFRSWPLALAGYNAGEQAVQRAVARTGSREFVGLSRALPLETQAYVPAVLAAAFPTTTSAAGPGAGTGHVVYAGME